MIVGMGLDMIEISRFAHHPSKRNQVARRIFTPVEITYASGKRRWFQHLAACFAAKEAFRKSMGQAFPWKEIGIIHAPSGAPLLELTGSARDAVIARNISVVHVSLTHSLTHAAAVVILESTP